MMIDEPDTYAKDALIKNALSKYDILAQAAYDLFEHNLNAEYETSDCEAYAELSAAVQTLQKLDRRIRDGVRNGEGLKDHKTPYEDRYKITDDLPEEFTLGVNDKIQLLNRLHTAERLLDETAQTHSFNLGTGERSEPIYGEHAKRAETLRRGPAMFVRDSDKLLCDIEKYFQWKAESYSRFIAQHGELLWPDDLKLAESAQKIASHCAEVAKDLEPASVDQQWTPMAR